MNEIKMIVELCAEDRERLDKIIAGLASRCDSCLTTVKEYMDAVESEKTVQDASKEGQQLFANLGEEVAPVVETPAKVEPAKPAPTVDEIQKKVMQLCVNASKEKKAAVRGVINEYAPNVSGLIEAGADLTEVWEKLIALEG